MTWITKKEKLTKCFEFKSFSEVVLFINEFTPACEKMIHHPDFKVFDYNKITFELQTHDINGISAKDHQLAAELDKIYNTISY